MHVCNVGREFLGLVELKSIFLCRILQNGVSKRDVYAMLLENV